MREPILCKQRSILTLDLYKICLKRCGTGTAPSRFTDEEVEAYGAEHLQEDLTFHSTMNLNLNLNPA